MIRILLLEDEPSIVTFLRHLLKDYGLIEATSAQEAILRFKEHNQDIRLLIADVSSGISVALTLRGENPKLPVILTSGYPVQLWDERDRADLSRLGGDNVKILQKPFYPVVLVDSIRAMIGESEHRQIDLRNAAIHESDSSPPLVCIA